MFNYVIPVRTPTIWATSSLSADCGLCVVQGVWAAFGPVYNGAGNKHIKQLFAYEESSRTNKARKLQTGHGTDRGAGHGIVDEVGTAKAN